MKVTIRLGLSVLVAMATLFAWAFFWYFEPSGPPIKIGILHSLTGTMAISEKPLVNALELAIEEANAEGGIKGQKIEALIVDCRSDAAYCAVQAERLITQEKVKALFGCWTSTCRQAVRAVVEKHHHLLFYPVQYEGLEISPNIIYTGAPPNQQIIPAVDWALGNLGKRIYLVGSDYIFPRTANNIIRALLAVRGGTIVGERYVPLGSDNVGDVVADIAKQHPDVVLNSINGDTNIAFFKALDEAGLTPDKTPVLSFSIGEVELAAKEGTRMAGHYAAWNYFQSISSPQNKEFVEKFRRRFGDKAVIGDSMEASYVGLKLWVQAAREAGSADVPLVQHIILRQTLLAPEGVVALDPATRHLWKVARVGKARRDGQFDILWQSEKSIEPDPFAILPLLSDREQKLQTGVGRKP